MGLAFLRAPCSRLLAATAGAVLFCALGAAGAWAQEEGSPLPLGHLYVSPFGGIALFQAALGLDDAPVLGLRLGYVAFPHVTIEGTFSYTPTSISPDPVRLIFEEFDTNQFAYTGGVQFHGDWLVKSRWLVPFVSLGAGGLTLDSDLDVALTGEEAESRTAFLFTWGGGVKIFLRPRLELRVEYRGLVAQFSEQEQPILGTSDTFNTSEVTGGITFYLPIGA